MLKQIKITRRCFICPNGFDIVELFPGVYQAREFPEQVISTIVQSGYGYILSKNLNKGE